MMMKKSLIALSGLLAANVAPVESASFAEVRPAFSVRAEMFRALPGDRVETVVTEMGQGIRWDVRYPQRETRQLVKTVSPGLLKRTCGMEFSARTRSHHQLLVLVQDTLGRRAQEIVNLERDWSTIELPYDMLNPRGEDGHPDPERICSISLVDFSASLQPQKKSRSIWVSDWKFRSVE